MIGRAANEDSLLKTPAQIRNRIRRAHRRGDKETMKKELQYYTQAGYKPVCDWDMEELARGRPRARDGKFRGAAPGWITEEVIREVQRELHKRTFGKLASNVSAAIKVITKLMEDDERDDKGRPVVDARTKLAAAQFVIEHIIGKPKAILEVNPADAVQQMFAAAIVLDDGQPQGHLPVLEGEIVEMEDGEE